MERKCGWISPDLEVSFEGTSGKNKCTLARFELDIGNEIFDQESLGSCTSNAIISALAFLKKKVNLAIVDFTSITTKEKLQKQ
jgi:hypothetical protein